MKLLKEVVWGSLEIFRVVIILGPGMYWLKQVNTRMMELEAMETVEMELEDLETIRKSIRMNRAIARLNIAMIHAKKWTMKSAQLGKLQKSLDLD